MPNPSIRMHTVDTFKPRTSINDSLIFDKVVYALYDGDSWKEIDADYADKEFKKMGKIPYSQKKWFLWNLAS